MINLGDYPTSAVIDFKWSTNSAAGAAITRATDGSIRIYKGNSTTERSSSAGITDTEDFDTLTGVHHLRIDTSDNTDAGFYAAGSEYQVVLAAATIDGQTVNACLAIFSIERSGGILALLKGANGLAAIKAETASILDDTDDIGAAGAGLTALATQASVNTIDNNVDAILLDTAEIGVAGAGLTAITDQTDNLPPDPADASVIAALIDALPTAAENAAAVATTAMTEAYSADGGTVTLAQGIYELLARDQEISISGTTMTVKKRDGSTTAYTLTLNDAASPTAITRSA